MTDLNLRDRNLRFALLKAVADAINEELALERGDHTRDLRTRYDDEGTKSFDVKLPGGGKVATISLTIPKPATTVVDEDALLGWCQEHMPTAITETVIPGEPERVVPATPERTVYSVDTGMLDVLLKGAKPVDPAGGLVVDEDGTVIDGVEYKPAGQPKSFSVRYEKDGRDALAVAYRCGELDHLIAGTTLPQLEASQAIPMGAGTDDDQDEALIEGLRRAVEAGTMTADVFAPAEHVGGCNEGCIDGEHLLLSDAPGPFRGAPEADPIVWGGDNS